MYPYDKGYLCSSISITNFICFIMTLKKEIEMSFVFKKDNSKMSPSSGEFFLNKAPSLKSPYSFSRLNSGRVIKSIYRNECMFEWVCL